MRVRITGQHLTVLPGLKDHLEAHLARLSKYCAQAIEAHVIVKLEKYLHLCEIQLKAGRLTLFGEGRSRGNFFQAADEAVDKLDRQLQKAHDKRLYAKGRAPARPRS